MTRPAPSPPVPGVPQPGLPEPGLKEPGLTEPGLTEPGLGDPGPHAWDAVIDGIDVDAVAAVVLGCAGVSGLDGGQYGEVTTYLPGRSVRGVTVGDGRVRVQVRAAWDTEAPVLATAITTAVSPLTGNRPVDVLIADIDDPSA